MTEPTGISLTPKQLADLREYSMRTDLHGEDAPLNQSEACRELLDLGRVCLEVIDEEGEQVLDLDSQRAREAWVRQACLAAIRRERREE